MIIRTIWQESETVSTNTEEVLADFQEVNDKGINNEIVVGSADVKALYPSLEINHTAKIVAEVFYKSDYSVKEIDKRELSLYLALNLKKEELQKENISKYCYKRKSNKGSPLPTSYHRMCYKQQYRNQIQAMGRTRSRAR